MKVMAFEIERRFLVIGESWRSFAGSAMPLRQGYLVGSPEGFTVRVRILEKEQCAWLTLKAPYKGITSHEFEYLIPVEDAESLWGLAPFRLTKTRYELNLQGGSWVVDCFEGANSPLVLAEVELASAEQLLKVPDWCWKGVTGVSEWSNAALAKMPLDQRSFRQRLDCRLA